MKKLLLIIFLPVVIFSCNRNKINITANATFTSEICIFPLSDDSITESEIATLAKQMLPGFKSSVIIPSSENTNGYVLKTMEVGKEYTLPAIQDLEYTGVDLSDNEKTRLLQCKQFISFLFFGDSTSVYDKQRKIAVFINELIKNKEVIVADFNTIQWFNPESWNSNRVTNFKDVPLNLTGQIVIQTYREGGYCRAVTMGMDKFCLPDISIKNFSCRDQNSYVSLLNAVVQTLSEHHQVEADSTLTIDLRTIQNKTVRTGLMSDLEKNAQLKATIKLKKNQPEAGDNPNIQLVIAFEDDKFFSSNEEQNDVLTKLFGASADTVINVTHDDLLLKTSEKERKRLPELKKRFNDTLLPGYSIMLKAPFTTSEGGREWMWIEVTKWGDVTVTGILQNEPIEVPNLKAGSVVTVYEKDIFDYILNKPDGSFEGDETGKIIESMQNH